MTFLRLLFIAGIIWLLYRLVKKLFVKTDSESRKSLETTPMVRCVYCNVYTTKQDAYLKEDNYFCSPEHYEKFIRKLQK